MNCPDFEAIILAIARGELFDAAASEQGAEHTAVCARCAGRLAEEQELITRVRSAAAEIAGNEASARVEAAVLTAFRNHIPVIAPEIMPNRALSRRRLDWRFVAIAAMILVLISAMFILWRQSVSNKNREEQRASEAPAAPQEDRVVAPLPEDRRDNAGRSDSKLASDQDPTGKNRRRVRAGLYGREVVTEFIPLMERVDLGSLDSMQVVRVELSSSSLIAIGLPVDAESNQTVKADVVLGHDGLAHAIRFVR